VVPFESFGAVSDSTSIITMTLSCISSEIKRVSCPLAFDARVRGGGVGILPSRLVWKKVEWWGYPMFKKTFGICITV